MKPKVLAQTNRDKHRTHCYVDFHLSLATLVLLNALVPDTPEADNA